MSTMNLYEVGELQILYNLASFFHADRYFLRMFSSISSWETLSSASWWKWYFSVQHDFPCSPMFVFKNWGELNAFFSNIISVPQCVFIQEERTHSHQLGELNSCSGYLTMVFLSDTIKHE